MTPYILAETGDYAVVFKPPKMHSAPLKKNDSGTLYDWFVSQCAASEVELIHRLDFETHGLVLFAKNKRSREHFKTLQDNGSFIKEYSAICKNNICTNNICKNDISVFTPPPGFPPAPNFITARLPLQINSYFRPYGVGRKLVRPVVQDGKYKEIAKDKGGFYQTEIIKINGNVFTVQIKRGFRHQIRCHLCWLGAPILNDPLYSHPQEPDPTKIPALVELALQELALRAHALFFTDPTSGEQCKHRIEPMK
ncbi:MAG: RNA pseudouridine synthase [Treponema sp.]|jgi:23S rRNA pseudouridine1911/1915/1917 synthase|nr:RNA pseudouridine synthase [Treponema sp.]